MNSQKTTTRRKPKARLRAVKPQPSYVSFTSPLPPNVTKTDCMALVVNDLTMVGYGIFPGDLCLAFRTDDIQSGDIVIWRTINDPEGTTCLRRFYPSPGGRVRFERAEGDGERLAFVRKVEEVIIWGRVWSVERAGRVVDLPVELRKGGAQ